MSTLIVLLNLKEGVTTADYEIWAETTDLPIARGLPSVDSFSLYRSASVLGSEDSPPYQYIEVIKINDMAQFGEDAGSEVMQKVSSQFQQFADNPIFIMTESVD
jgi:hypothetical protein